MTSPDLSIVLTSYSMDRYGDLCELLDSIKAQTPDDSGKLLDIETIFISERCPELSQKIRVYADRIGLAGLRVIDSDQTLGLGGARNLGTQESKGTIVAFIDDDVILFPDWARQMLVSYQYDSPIGVTGAAFPRWQDKKLDWLPKRFYWLISCTEWTGWDKLTEARSLWGMNMSLKREAFAAAGSFNTRLGYHSPIAEDLELSLRVRNATGQKFLFNPAVKVWHKVYAYRISRKFVAARAHHIGTSRRILRSLDLKNLAPVRLEQGILGGILGIYLRLPLEFFRKPADTWKKFILTSTIVVYAAVGFLFPGRASRTALEIKAALDETKTRKDLSYAKMSRNRR
jgi:glucosyl-dolichyl phosphate glucuronosyltransferase